MYFNRANYQSSYSPKKSSFSSFFSFFSFGSSKKKSTSGYSKKSSGGWFSKIKSGVKKGYSSVAKKAKSVKRSITSKAKKLWKSAAKKVTNKAKGIGSKITKAASKAKSAVNRAKSKVKTVVKKVSSRVKSAVKRGASHIAAKARSIKNSAAKKVKSITKKVKSFAKNVKNKVNHLIAKSKKTISKAVQKVKTATKRYATYVRSSLQKGSKAAAKALGNKMKQAWNNAKKHASNSWNTVKTTVKKVINHPAAQRFTKGVLGVLQIAGGLVQVGAGVALSTTGLGALLGVPMAAHGAADVWQGFASTINAIAGKQVIPEVNFMQEAYKAVGGWIGGAKGEAIANYVFYIADLGLGFINAGKLAAQLKHVKDLSKLEQLKYLKVQYITQPFQTLKGKAVNVTKYGYNIVNKMSSGYNKAAKAAKNGFNHAVKGAKSVSSKGKTFAKSITSKGKAVYKTAKANLNAAKEAAKTGIRGLSQYFRPQPELAGFGKVGVPSIKEIGNESRKVYNSVKNRILHASTEGKTAKGVTQADERLTSLTKEQLKGKPKNSPNPDKWFKKNGTISIDDEGAWTYHDWEGNSVSYPDGYPDFKSAGMVEQEVNIGPFQGYNKDFPRGDELAPNGPISESSTWHHHQDGVTLQEVLTKLHERFRHRGGMSKIKK